MIEGWIEAADAILARGGDVLFGVATQIEAPVMIVHGSEDTGNPIPMVTALANKIRRCQFLLFDGIGHDVQDEAPRELHQSHCRMVWIQRKKHKYTNNTPTHRLFVRGGIVCWYYLAAAKVWRICSTCARA
jgi:hypothetical protein